MKSKRRQLVSELFGHRSTRRILLGERSRWLRIEPLEDRRMLAAAADIVLFVDESISAGEEFTWVSDIVNRPGGLNDYLTDPARGIVPRYGLVGLGEGSSPWGHSHLLDVTDANGDGDKLFGTAAQFANIADDTTTLGGAEPAWDAIEHAIAEYEFRPEAAVIFVLFRRDDLPQTDYAGNDPPSDGVHTYTGTLAALNSYNVALNTIIEALYDPAVGDFVLGVEADETDGKTDGRHIALVNVGPDKVLVSHQGSNSGTFVDSGKSILISKTAAPQIAGPSLGDYRAQATTYAFEDISGTGTQITGWDESFSPFKELTSSDLGSFAFPFFGETRTGLFINYDGSITFEAPIVSVEQNADSWTTNKPEQPRIAPLWDFYSYGYTGPEVYWQVKNSGQTSERLIVQWDAFQIYNTTFDPANRVTFQATLYKNGNIVFSYEDIDLNDPGDSAFTEGRQATVGIATDQYLPNHGLSQSVFIDGVHAVNGLPGVEEDFVRLAWDTGGVAWNNDVISGVSGTGSTANPDYVAAFDEAFIESIGRQILRKHTYGDVVFPEVPVVQINMGGPAIPGFIADTDPILGANFMPLGTTLLQTTQAIVRNGNSMAGDANTLNVFKTARTKEEGGLPLSIPASLVPNGRYVVELMFASFESHATSMDVTFENDAEPVLNDYNIEQDYAKIPTSGATAPEYELFPVPLGENVPIVKRYAVEVNDGNGLQISLTGFNAAVSGIRVLKTPPPRIGNVVVKGSTWAPDVEYSFATLVGLGQQLRPIPTQNADTIEIHFDGPVNISGNMLTLNRTVRNSNGSATNSVPTAGSPAPYDFDYDPDTYVARWVFDSPLGDGKFAIHLSDDVTGGGNPLDGDWTNEKRIGNLLPPTPDNWHDDQPRAFAVGDGMPGSQGGEFRFHFAILVADFNGDGSVEGQDELEYTEQFVAQDRWGDANGDGVVSGADLSIWAATGPTMLPLRRKGGADINDDEIVNGVDYGIWLAGWGQTGDGDIDGDGDTDGYDFMLWQSAFGSESAWHIAMPGAAQNLTSIYGSQTLVGLAAPQVLNVIISGSLSMHAPFSFDTVDGSGDQLKTVPVGGANTISIVFSEGVNITAESLFLVSLHLAVRPTLAEFSYDPLTHTATWRYEGWPLADQYLLSLSDRVTDADGNWLDGEWVNPRINWSTTAAISEFPSGDGDPGGMFNFVMTLLPGDANLDGAVNNGDYVIWQPLLGADGVFQDGDFNGDGMVTGDDAAIWSLTNGLYYQAIWVGCDLDGDLDVDDVDLQVIFDNAGMSNPTFYDGDFNFDGEVDADDLDIAMAQYGLHGLFINAVW